MAKAAVILLADIDSHEGAGRMSNALSTGSEFADAGDDVVIVFDGAGTRWVPELAKPDHRYHGQCVSLKDHIAGACEYCARAFGVKDAIEASGVTLLKDYKGHPSLHSLVRDGYQVVTF